MYPYMRIAVEDPVRDLSSECWRGLLEKFGDPTLGNLRDDDFKTPASNTTDASADEGWFIQDAAAGGTVESFVSVAGKPEGVRRLSATTGTDHFGIEAHRGKTATNLGDVVLPTHTSNPKSTVAFHARVGLDLADTYFVGLTEPIVEFLSATSTLPATSDYIGFSRTDAGDLKFVCANDNNGGTAVTDEVTILAAADIPDASGVMAKLEFRVNADNTVEIYVDDVRYLKDTSGDLIVIDPDALPIESLTPKLAILRGATADLATVTMDVDRVTTYVAE